MSRVTIAALLALSLAPGCTQRGFVCGSPAADNPEVFRRCDRAQEICVCATGGCAKPTSASDRCASGFRYVEAPFADPDIARQCVESTHVAARTGYLTHAQIGQACEPEANDAGPNHAHDAGTGEDAS